jgi:hypothetical protein
MKKELTAGFREENFRCLKCGTKKSVSVSSEKNLSKHEGIDLSELQYFEREEGSSEEIEISLPSSVEESPQKKSSNTSSSTGSKQKKTSITQKRRRVSRAKQYSEMRQISKDLIGRINDMEIQVERRLEELQSVAVRLQQLVDTFDPK